MNTTYKWYPFRTSLLLEIVFMVNRFREARDRGGDFLANIQDEDGSMPGFEQGADAYWGMPIALQVSGHSDSSNRLLQHIRENGFTSEGDIGPSQRSDLAYAYPISWIVEGAHRLGQFDLSQRGMDFIMRSWDSESGGFYSNFSQRSEDGKQDLWITSACGRAALYTGRIEVARAVGMWFERLMELQPNYPAQMFTVYSRSVGLHSEPSAGDDPNRYILNMNATTDERFFNPGISGGFLARLYMATGENKWLDLAKEYMMCADIASEYLYTILRAGKTGWAAALLYTLTGESKYRDMAVRIGETLLRTQAEEGYWSGIDSVESTPMLNRTAEMVVWLDEIYQSV